MTQNPIIGSVNDILDHITRSDVGSHTILIHPNLDIFRDLYSQYIKRQLQSNELVLILPYYETITKAREVLSSSDEISNGTTGNQSLEEHKVSNDHNTINDGIDKYEKEGSLVIKDSVNAYLSNDYNNTTPNHIGELIAVAEKSGKSCVNVIADLGSFFHHSLGDTQKLVDHELSLPSQFDNGLKLKGLCVYNKEDFNRFSEEQKQRLFEHHGQVFIIEDT